MTRPARRGVLATTTLLLATVLLAACGAATTAPKADPARNPNTPATFDGATFDSSTWR
ncbi:hypothetical protein BH23DEI1_BH23DEI1_11560 [soil metagenome]